MPCCHRCKNAACYVHGFEEGFGVELEGYLLLAAPPYQVFGGYVAYQFIFGHRAAAYTLHGAVVSAAASLVCGGNFFFPFIGRAVKMGAYADIFKFGYELTENVIDITRLCHTYGVAHSYGFYTQAGQTAYPVDGHRGAVVVAIRIAEAHGYVYDQLLATLHTQVLHLFHLLQRLGYSFVGIAQLEGFGDGKREAKVADLIELHRLGGASGIGYYGQQPGARAGYIQQLYHLAGIGQLWYGFGRNKGAKIEYIETYTQQGIEVLSFFGGGYHAVPPLHGIAGAFYKFYMVGVIHEVPINRYGFRWAMGNYSCCIRAPSTLLLSGLFKNCLTAGYLVTLFRSLSLMEEE